MQLKDRNMDTIRHKDILHDHMPSYMLTQRKTTTLISGANHIIFFPKGRHKLARLSLIYVTSWLTQFQIHINLFHWFHFLLLAGTVK